MRMRFAYFMAICLAVLVSCGKVDFDKIITGRPYTGSFQGHECVVVIDHAEAGNVAGRIYLDDGNLVVYPIPFSSDVKKSGKGKLWIGDEKKNLGRIVIEGDSLLGEIDKAAFSLCLYRKTELPFKAQYLEQRYEVGVKQETYAKGVKGYWSSYPDTNEKFTTIYMNRADRLLSKEDLDLDLDVYFPKGVKKNERRPLLMLIHGGAFYNGDKRDAGFEEMGRHFASRGYVVASINYRLGFAPLAADASRAGYRALQDAHAATCFMIGKAKEYGIDTTKIYAAGISAGAITALNLAFMREEDRPEATRNGGVFGWLSSTLSTGLKVVNTGADLINKGMQLINSEWGIDWGFDVEATSKELGLDNDLGPINAVSGPNSRPFQVKAVVNMWGAVHSLQMLEHSPKTDILSFHGDADRIVPFAHGYPFNGVLESYVDSMIIGLPKPIKFFAEMGRKHLGRGKPFNEWVFNPVYGSSQIHEKAKGHSEFHAVEGGKHSMHQNEDRTLSTYFSDTILPVTTRFLCRETVGGKMVRLVRNGSWVEAKETDNVAELHWQVDGGVVLSEGNRDKAKVLLFGDAERHSISAGGKYKNGTEFKESLPEIGQ